MDYRASFWLSSEQRRVMGAIEACRTASLGGHREQCDSCGHQRIAYNSCRNRHCPKCQSLERERWLKAREADLLPVEYFHVVFTLPDQIARVALMNKRVVYRILFEATWETLRRIAADPKHLGAEIGVLAILHTWGQTLTHHPHLHCVVPGGGLSKDGSQWISCRRGFFLPVRVLSKLFRRLFLEKLRRVYENGDLRFPGTIEALSDPAAFHALISELRNLPWVVYAKRPFGGPRQVLNYLGRYTHRVAISNNRLVAFDGEKVTFSWKDYRHNNAQKTMTLEANEFIRRFLQHVLPRGFQRIRSFGLLSNRRRAEKLRQCRLALGVPQEAASPSSRQDAATVYEEVTGESLVSCPSCKIGRMRVVEILPTGRWHTFPSRRPSVANAPQLDSS